MNRVTVLQIEALLDRICPRTTAAQDRLVELSADSLDQMDLERICRRCRVLDQTALNARTDSPAAVLAITQLTSLIGAIALNEQAALRRIAEIAHGFDHIIPSALQR